MSHPVATAVDALDRPLPQVCVQREERGPGVIRAGYGKPEPVRRNAGRKLRRCHGTSVMKS